MSANLNAEEVEALMSSDEEAPSAESGPRVNDVQQRDFGHLKRLDAIELAEARRKLESALPAIEAELAVALRQPVELGLASASESNAEGLFRGESGPSALVRFRCQGHPGWCRWELVSAISALERVLGSAPDAPQPTERLLSGLERTLLERVLRTLLLQVGSSLGLGLTDFEALPTFKHAGHYSDCAAVPGSSDVPAPDPYRLSLELDLRVGDELSGLRLLLPVPERAWIRPSPPPETSSEGLPLHLLGVGMDVAVHLGHASLSLRELLALEVGDVVPLSTPRQHPAVLDVDGRAIGLAHLGQSGGRLAIRITDLDPGLVPGLAPKER